MSPPPPVPSSSSTKPKKPKGRAPAHQNSTAWRHNPKSKKTAKILSSPISGVCRRCRDKLEWRKRYRKYKPRSVVGACNLCGQKRVYAAYHTVCEPCSLGGSEKVASLLLTLVGESGDEDQGSGPRQICCVCVKERAGPNVSSDVSADFVNADSEVLSLSSLSRPLRLREIKALERQAGRHRQRKGRSDATTSIKSKSSDHHHLREGEDASHVDSGCEVESGDSGTGDDGHEHAYSTNEDSGGAEGDCAAAAANSDDDDDDDDDEDPFLRAVGGRSNLLVGEAYQQRRLELERQADLKLQYRPTDTMERGP